MKRLLMAALVAGLPLAAAAQTPEPPAEMPYVAQLKSKARAQAPAVRVLPSPKLDLLMLVAARVDQERTINRQSAANRLGTYWSTNSRQFGTHEAVQQLRHLRSNGLWGDRLLELAMHLSEPPELALLKPWSRRLLEAASPRGKEPVPATAEMLDRFRESLVEFARDVRFNERYQEKLDVYAALTGQLATALEARDPAAFNSRFWGLPTPGDTYLIPSPVISGGYLAELEVGDSRHQFLAVGPVLPEGEPDPHLLHHLVHHELSHTLVDPVLRRRAEALERSKTLWLAIDPFMESYLNIQSWPDCIGEHLMRAYNIHLLGRTDPVFAELSVTSEMSAGFFYTRLFMELLAEFDAGRAETPSFADFMPVLEARLEAESREAAEFIPVTQAPDLDLRNAGFEERTGGWLLPGWSLVDGGSVSAALESRLSGVAVDTAVKHGGGSSVRITNDESTTSLVAVEQGPLAIRGGSRVKVTGWIRTDDVKREGLQQKVCGFYVVFLNKRGEVLSRGESDSAVGTLDWTELSGTFTAPQGANRFAVGILLGMSGTAWADDLQVERLD